MHQSFGGGDFRLLDLYGSGLASVERWPLVISSLKLADRQYRARLLDSHWDLVIVDEAHRLLWNPQHYELVERLAGQIRRLLLLSAVPARERDTELLRLLQLIDPATYAPGGVAAARFSELYTAQAAIGRRLRIVSRQFEDPKELDREQLHADVERLLSLDVLKGDRELMTRAHAAVDTVTAEDALARYRRLIDAGISRYRISRRILK